MKFYSTNNTRLRVDLKTAVLDSLPADNGLYMPETIPQMSDSFIAGLKKYSFQEMAYQIALPYLVEDFTEQQVADIVNEIYFSSPLESLDYNLHVLELWHGPSLAFKDFGARFMAAVMSQLTAREDKKLTILVATSGDTGGAVASGFLGVANVEVIILYPKGKVSPLQEKQLTTLGENITALEVDGAFDDCQALVKKAFLDEELNKLFNLSSANSINIARLIPQSFYYFAGYAQLEYTDDVVFCIPSGNFGNLTAGLLAKIMGLPIKHFIAAVNANDVVPHYLHSGQYLPKPSVQTISNAMDVGDPSNFRRMLDLFSHDHAVMKDHISSYSIDDRQTSEAISEIFENNGYIMDPHGAVGYVAANKYLSQNEDDQVIILGTAHPAKFLPVMEPILGEIPIPDELTELIEKEKMATDMTIHFNDFKDWLMARAN
jgi:threonine synthase